MADPFEDHQDFILRQTKLILDSYRHWLKRNLIPPGKDFLQDARNLFEAPFAVLSANNDPDPVLNYGNKTVLDLWEMNWETLTRTPSRQTAEPVHRGARETFLKQVKERGYIENYEGIRISSTGRRFRIQKALVWNLIDAKQNYVGQAATFSAWEFCE